MITFFFFLVKFPLLPSPLLMQSLLYSFHFSRCFLSLTSQSLAELNRICSFLLPACPAWMAQLRFCAFSPQFQLPPGSGFLVPRDRLATQGGWTCPTSTSQNSFCGGDGPWGRGRTHWVVHQGVAEQFLLLRLLLELPVVPRMPGRQLISWSSYFLPWLSILLGPIECMISLWAWLFLVGWGCVASSRSYRIFHTMPLLLHCSKGQSLPCVGVGNDDILDAICWFPVLLNPSLFPSIVLPVNKFG